MLPIHFHWFVGDYWNGLFDSYLSVISWGILWGLMYDTVRHFFNAMMCLYLLIFCDAVVFSSSLIRPGTLN